MLRGMFILAALGVAGCSIAAADPLPAKLTCKLSGTAGCAPGGICVGGGVSDPAVKMVVDVSTREISINGLIGHILGKERVDSAGMHTVVWRWRLINLDHFYTQTTNGRLFFTLMDGQDEVEFECSLGS